jgi:dienelactone hydrolase
MNLVRYILGILAILLSGFAFAQYGSPESLKAEMNQGDDLAFAKEARELGSFTDLSNAVFAPPKKIDDKLPALVILHTCGGISQHTRLWAEEALKRGYVVLTLDGMRGLKSDCGSPSKISNGRLIKDALDAVAHLAALPYVDSQRISVIGFSKGALIATWLGSSSVANTLRPGTPPIASAVSAYAFCALAPSRGRPQGITILQPDTDRPLLVLMGGKDNETPPASCLELLPKLKERGAPVQWHLYPEATHAWDSPDKDGFSKVDFKNDRVTYKYDHATTEDSMKRVFDFLPRRANNK